VLLSGSGRLQALSIALRWDASVAEPLNVSAGELVSSAGGVVFSPGPGRADAALLGAGAGMTGEGAVASVRFRAVAAGAPNVSIARATGRSSSNKDVAVTLKNPVAVASLVSVTELFPVIPNPTRGSAMVQYALAKRGPVDLSVFSVDGRHVKTLAGGVHEAGRFSVSWDGADEHGSPMKSGMYFVRYEAAGQHLSRVLTVIR
jgi:FlgD Ig-like domain